MLKEPVEERKRKWEAVVGLYPGISTSHLKLEIINLDYKSSSNNVLRLQNIHITHH